MRIVGGRLRGRRLPVPKVGVRPTSERVREALMSMLGPNWAERSVLDCYAGSGAFGFEALSRGASNVTFVEHDQRTARSLLATSTVLGVERQVHLIQDDASRALRGLARRHARFDVLFFDPPYAASSPLAILSDALVLAKEGAALVWECAAGDTVPAQVGDWQQALSRRYGATSITVYRRNDGGS